MSKPTDNRPYFRVERYRDKERLLAGIWLEKYRIVSIAGGDTIAENIPSADIADAMRKAAEEARK